jgi:hypothetical protein
MAVLPPSRATLAVIGLVSTFSCQGCSGGRQGARNKPSTSGVTPETRTPSVAGQLRQPLLQFFTIPQAREERCSGPWGVGWFGRNREARSRPMPVEQSTKFMTSMDEGETWLASSHG